MSAPALLDEAAVKRPMTWRYFAGAVAAYPLLLVLWLIFDFRVLNPELVSVDVETTMDKVRWYGVPLAAIALLFGGSWLVASFEADAREREWQQKTQQLKAQEAGANTEQARREYVLEVIGLGVTVEKYRQGKLWEALQKGTPFSSIREQDPKKYEWSSFDKYGVAGSRANDALENGAALSPMYWGAPSFYAGSPILDPAEQPSEIQPMAGLASGAETTGMAWHLFVTAPWLLAERPDQLLEQVFAFFDAHSDVPYVMLHSEDSMSSRDSGLPPGAARLVEDGYYIPQMPDSTAVFVLARRERVEPLRPYVWDDPDNDYLQENLRMMYYDLQENVPTPEKLVNPEKHHRTRLPTVAEWLKAAAAFAKRPVFDKHKADISLAAFRRWLNDPPKDWKPTPWFPVPWNRNQMEAFDNLPSLGFIHRPVFV
ncbi:MAG: type VI lipase adapter Tla3 domain-containing protein, partial [Telluria sp.]